MTDADLDFFPFGPPDPVVTAPATVRRDAPQVASVPHRPLGALHAPWLRSRPDDATIAHKTNKRAW